METEDEGPAAGEPVPALEALLVEETLADTLLVLQPEAPSTVSIPTPRDVAMPGMVQAIAEGERLVATAESQSVLSVLVAVEAAMTPLPPFRVNPHDFILPGELPPLLLDDSQVDGAREGAEAAQQPLGQVEALQATVDACCASERWSDAAVALEQVIAVAPDALWAHQRQVEVALRLGGGLLLRDAYLALGAALTRRGDEAGARAVSARVLALFPDDQSTAPPEAGVPAGSGAPGRDGDTVAARIRVAEPVATGDDVVDFEVVLRLFKDGVARSLGEEDAGSRYDLGVAYKEMGLIDDAVAEFQKALRSAPHRLPAYEALGQCFVEQGRHQVAITLLSRALHESPSVGQDDRQRVGMLYLLAYANEALQRRDEARIHYQRVFQIDSSFRDVAARLALLARGQT
jgi:tetratricopeptide (TPR) repeat protein